MVGTGTATVLRGDALALPLADASVDLVVTSPPYFALRSYTDDGEHYAGQLGSEATPDAFVSSLLAATRECMRVLKPTGSLWVNLGDKYATGTTPGPQSAKTTIGAHPGVSNIASRKVQEGVRTKSLLGIPWRFALRCIDDLGLILRAEVIWSKPNGLPESVTDRVRRSHEQWLHFTMQPRYFSAVDEIRQQATATTRHAMTYAERLASGELPRPTRGKDTATNGRAEYAPNPLGKLPGSVWTVATEPLRVPDELGVDHFAAFPTEWPRRIIAGWSPRGVCVECGEGRRPVTVAALGRKERDTPAYGAGNHGTGGSTLGSRGPSAIITGYACACPEPSADTTPAVVLDPFGGTGTTALVAKALGRHGVTVDRSSDYCRLAEWRVNDPGELAKAMRVDKPKPQTQGQDSLLDLLEGEA